MVSGQETNGFRTAPAPIIYDLPREWRVEVPLRGRFSALVFAGNSATVLLATVPLFLLLSRTERSAEALLTLAASLSTVGTKICLAVDDLSLYTFRNIFGMDMPRRSFLLQHITKLHYAPDSWHTTLKNRGFIKVKEGRPKNPYVWHPRAALLFRYEGKWRTLLQGIPQVTGEAVVETLLARYPELGRTEDFGG